ncbi:hypothetical protein F4781DRAFT_434321 [Annulohypoxylon bovei var. microspora]|nr:hypothetical protein F4781DRAFT_434321 [Annulohypoxylon bovei var. microspora]
MDPLAAVSLAANIFAFLEAGCKAVREFNDLRLNRLIMTRENVRIRKITDELKYVSNGLAADGPASLRSLAGECVVLCEELLDSLKRLTVKDPNSKLESSKVVWNSFWKASEISSKQATEKQSGFNKKLDGIENDIRQLSDSRSNHFAQLRSDLLSAIQSCSSSSTQEDRPQTGSAKVSYVLVGQRLLHFQDTLGATLSEVQILMKLRFDGIFDREDGIKNATDGTFSWPLQEKDLSIDDVGGNIQPEGSTYKQLKEEMQFRSWLTSGRGIFHISGKAGSGKSTLMKKIWLESQTQECLKQWAGDQNLCYAAFFFWSSGNEYQKSLTGLYRSILFSVLNKHPNLIPDVFPKIWYEDQEISPNALFNLTRPHNIEEALQILIGKTISGNYCLCLLIDGLDEYDADSEDHWNLAKKLRDWAIRSDGNIKLCVSSRPHIQFQQTFESSKHPDQHQIHLHKLNSSDIERHCETMFTSDEDFNGLKTLRENYKDLINEIVPRAEGVFLWAVLVVRIILSEARRHGRETDLRRKLDELPGDMDKLYDRIIGSLSRPDREIANRILLVVLTNPFRSDVNALCLRWLADENEWRRACSDTKYTESEREDHVSYVKKHLDGWTQGLVEAVDQIDPFRYDSRDFATKIKFFHRTIREYLSKPERLHELLSSCPKLGLADLHAHLRLAEIKCLGHDISDGFCEKLYPYGYEILHMRFDTCMTQGKDENNFCQVAWSLLKELASVLPSNFLVTPFLGLAYLPFYSYVELPPPYQMSLIHFAASLGRSSDYMNAGVIDSAFPDAEPSARNLLLSTCLPPAYSLNGFRSVTRSQGRTL